MVIEVFFSKYYKGEHNKILNKMKIKKSAFFQDLNYIQVLIR